MKTIRTRITYANVMSSLAVFLVLGGATAIAAKSVLPKNSVGTKQLKANAVTAAKIRKNAIRTAKIKNNAVTGAKVDEATLSTVPSAAAITGYTRKGIVRAVATDGASFEAARSASPEIAFFSAGPLSIYAKCLTDASGPFTYGIFYVRTSQDGAIVDSDTDDFDGEPFLNSATAESARELAFEEAGANKADYYGFHSPEFAAMAPDGTVVRGQLQIATKNGNLAGGNGLYGDGDVCLFAGDLTVLNG